jgi:diguanylate cyclase (GGDEF)-like protein/PAS domain S-box-containing protein
MAERPEHDAPPATSRLRREPLLAHTLDGRIVFANDVFYDRHGLAPSELSQMAPWAWIADMPEERHAAILKAIVEHGHHSFDLDDPFGEDGPARRLRIESWLVDWNGESLIVSAERDVSEEYHTARILDFRSMLLDEVSDAVFCHTLDGRMIYVNNAACVERGYTREELMRLHLDDLTSKEAAEATAGVLMRLIEDGFAAFESEDVTADGRRMTVEVHSRLVELEGEPVVVSVVRDISERKRAQEAVERLAFTDPLTGLANRRMLMDLLDTALEEAARTGTTVALAFIDLDHLKRVNDRHGHVAGDRMLELAAQRLSARVRKGDTVARFGGDEFVVLCTGVDGPEAAEHVAEKLAQALREPFDIDGITIESSASIGMAVNDPPTIEAAELLANADSAMYAVKDETRDAYAMYTPKMRLAPDPEGQPREPGR